MQVEAKVLIDADRDVVWSLVSDIENAEKTVTGIEKVEILEKPETGLVGLKWRETRTLFGKTATEVMWITAAEQPAYYETEARSHGSVYRTRLSLEDRQGKTRLAMNFGAEAETFFTKVLSAVFGVLMKGPMRKAIQKDLDDVKRAAERAAAEPRGQTME